ncbi:MAG: sugar phosphate isomerase/epimerase [Chitinophagaceae bacterium]
MSYQRREFLKVTTALASGLALTTLSGKLAGCGTANRAAGASEPFGIQLYTLREDMPKDPKGVLKQLSTFGYQQLESFEHNKLGMFWGMKNTEFKTFVGDLGMKLVSSHADINKDFERKAGEAGAIGMNYLICPYLGPQKSMDDYKRAAEKFNQSGEICKKNGLRFAYHNHDYSFVPIDGQMPQDVMMAATDKDLVDYEMDIYWVVTAGQDPIQWLNKYPGRFTLVHVKDRMKAAPLTEKEASVTPGTGSINFAEILSVGKKQGLKYNIIEQERYDGTTPLKAAQEGAAFMKALKLA